MGENLKNKNPYDLSIPRNQRGKLSLFIPKNRPYELYPMKGYHYEINPYDTSGIMYRQLKKDRNNGMEIKGDLK